MRAPAGSTHFMLRIRILLIYIGYLGDEGTSRLHPLYAQNQDFIDLYWLPKWWGHQQALPTLCPESGFYWFILVT